MQKLTLILIVSILPIIRLESQAPAGATSSDSVAILNSVAQHIRANYHGKLAFDVGMACKYGRACEEPSEAGEKAKYQQKAQMFSYLRQGTGAGTIPLRTASKCPTARKQSCRLVVDYYFQVFEPIISKDSARFVFFVGKNTPVFGEDNYIANMTLTLRLARVAGKWRITEEVTPH